MNLKGTATAKLALLVLFVAACNQPPETTGLSLQNAWISAGPPTQNRAAGYFRLTNNTTGERVLIGGQSPAIQSVELHTTMLQEGVQKMRRLDQVELAAGGELVFQPGGHHLMLVGLKSPLQVGDTLPLTLIFQGGESLSGNFAVRRPGSQNHDNQHQHHP